MQYPRRMQILEPAQNLVHKHLDVIGGERLVRDDDLVQVALEQLGYHVSVLG